MLSLMGVRMEILLEVTVYPEGQVKLILDSEMVE